MPGQWLASALTVPLQRDMLRAMAFTRIESPVELSALQAASLWQPEQPLRLHLGCGQQHFEGYINIDYPPDEHNLMNIRADAVSDITELEFPAGSVDEVRSHHVFEHFSRVSALALLMRWHRWLKIGGTLHIETPDLHGSALRFLATDTTLRTRMGIARHLAGDQAAPWAYHVDHWFPERFVRTLSALGFSDIKTDMQSWPDPPYLSNVHAIGRKTRELSEQELLEAADELLWDSTVADVERPAWEIWRAQLRKVLAKELGNTRPAGLTPAFAHVGRRRGRPYCGIIFSKDRPLQLDAAIRSFYRSCQDAHQVALHVLYCATGTHMQSLYEKVQADYPGVEFVTERSFRSDLLGILEGAGDYVLFLVDDNLFVQPFRIGECGAALYAQWDAIGFSLRLGENTTYCYPADRENPRPAFWALPSGVHKFPWTSSELDFGYPFDLSSSVYRTHDLIPLLQSLSFRNPNTLESEMYAARLPLAERLPSLLCYQRSVAFCAPMNVVQKVFDNRHAANPAYSVQALAQQYEQGLRIDVDKLRGHTPRGCHEEIELPMHLREASPWQAALTTSPLGRRVVQGFEQLRRLRASLGR